MKRAEGTGSPKALTLTSVSRAASRAAGRPPIAMRDDPGAGRDHRERRAPGEKMRQERGIGIVDAAMDRGRRVKAGRRRDLGGDRPEDVGGTAERRHQRWTSPCRSTSEEKRPACGFQRSVWQPSEVRSEARTPVRRKVQYCGYMRIAAVRAASAGKRRNCQKSCAPRVRPAGSRGEPVSAKGARAAS